MSGRNTEAKAACRGNEYGDGMIEHDGDVGKLLNKLDELGIADNTIVVYATDNGPNQFSWPDAATTPFRSEEGYQLGRRVPRSPQSSAGPAMSSRVRLPTAWCPVSTGSRRMLAAAGDPDVKGRLLTGWKPEGSATSFRNHLDGFNQLDYITGKSDKSARNEFYYFDDDGDLVGIRYDDWKVVFKEQPAPGGFAVWQTPLITWASSQAV